MGAAHVPRLASKTAPSREPVGQRHRAENGNTDTGPERAHFQITLQISPSRSLDK